MILVLQCVVDLLQNGNNMNFMLWITGFSGSGKTTIGKKVYESFADQRVALIDGDEIRKIIECFNYDVESRKYVAWTIQRMCQFLLQQNISVICCTISLFEEIHEANSKINSNIIYAFLESDRTIRMQRKPDVYKNSFNLVGDDIACSIPKDCIVLKNEAIDDINKNAEELVRRIKCCSPINQ